MKKILAFFAAVAMCVACFSCDDDNNDEDISENVPETEEVGDTLVENEFRTYEEKDFKTINVPITFTDEEAPVVLKSCDIPDIDFGERLAPCKTSDDPSQFDPLRDRGYTWTDENGVEHKSESTYMQVLDTPEEGMVTGAVKYGDCIYMTVNYDIFCSGCHEWSVYEYDINTKETKEVYNYSGIDRVNDVGYWFSPQIVAGHMLYTAYDPSGGASKQITEAIDLKTGERKAIYTSDGDYYNYLTNGLDKVEFYSTELLDKLGNKMKLTIKEYDFNTGELKTIADSEETKVLNTAFSGMCAYMKKPFDSRKCEFVTEHYCIKTNTTNACILYASDKKAMYVTGDDTDILHTYDLEKMEHYITDLGDYSGLQAVCGENIILSDVSTFSEDSVGNIFYMIPEMGLVFQLGEDIPHDTLTYSGGTVTMNAIEETYVEITENGTRGYNKPTAVYWTEDREG